MRSISNCLLAALRIAAVFCNNGWRFGECMLQHSIGVMAESSVLQSFHDGLCLHQKSVEDFLLSVQSTLFCAAC